MKNNSEINTANAQLFLDTLNSICNQNNQNVLYFMRDNFPTLYQIAFMVPEDGIPSICGERSWKSKLFDELDKTEILSKDDAYLFKNLLKETTDKYQDYLEVYKKEFDCEESSPEDIALWNFYRIKSDLPKLCPESMNKKDI